MKRKLLILLISFAVAAPLPAADDPVTAVQKSLKELGFFHVESSGQIDEETRNGLRRFQIRMGLKPTGEIDTETVQALAKATAPLSGEAGFQSPPQSLRERALQTNISDREFLEQIEISDAGKVTAPTAPISSSSPAPEPTSPIPRTVAPASPPAESGERSRDLLSPEEAASFVQSYLKAAEESRPENEISFYAAQVDYFDSGRVSRKFVAQDQASYYRRWPNREFTVLGTPELVSSNERSATVRFRMRYQLSNGRDRASGATENVLRLRREPDGLKIVGIQERKLRE